MAQRYQHNTASTAFSHVTSSRSAEKQEKSVFFLALNQIRVPSNGKKTQNQNAVIRIADTIKKYGVIEPLELRIVHENGLLYYELAGNEAAWYAAQLAGIETVPCVMSENDPAREAEHIFAQIQQKRLHMFEQAYAFRMLTEEYGLTQGDIARRLGVSQSAIANKLRLLQYSTEEMQRILRQGLSERHARAILRLKTAEDRMRAIQIISEQQMTVSDTESLIERMLLRGPKAAKNNASRPQQQNCTVPCSTQERQENRPKETPFLTFDEETCGQNAVLPRKFALQSLQPLYNSVDRALSIFRKTGYRATMYCEESAEEVCITIKIPTKAE